MKIGSLFSGVGGLELGLEWAGVGHTVFQVEQDPYCLQVLARHWPNAERFTDVREVGAHNLPPVDVLCGGFPCQDISDAGKRAGIDGARSGLWFEYARIVRELRPRFVVVENVRALLVRGLDRVLGDLAGIGYDAEWSTLSACAVGASHVRQRVFVVAYPNGLDGRSRLRDTTTRSVGPLQTHDGFARARTSWGARLANPSELYRGADGISNGPQRNRAIGNAVVPQVAEVIGRRLLALLPPLSPSAAMPTGRDEAMTQG